MAFTDFLKNSLLSKFCLLHHNCFSTTSFHTSTLDPFTLFVQSPILSAWSRLHPASLPGRMDISMWGGCSEGSVYEAADSQAVPKRDSPTQDGPTCWPHQPCSVQSGWFYAGSLPSPHCSLVLICTGLLPIYTHALRQKGHCALNTNTSSLTSESF